MKIIKLTIVILSTIFISGCTAMLQEADLLTPNAATSEYFVTKSAGFLGTLKNGNFIDTYYTITLKIRKPFNEGAYIEAAFEKPSDSTSTICVEKSIIPDDEEVSIESPIITGFRNHKNYEVIVYVYSDKSKSNLIGQHKQLIRFYEPSL